MHRDEKHGPACLPVNPLRDSRFPRMLLQTMFLVLVLLLAPTVVSAANSEDRYRQEIELDIVPVVGLEGKHTDEWGVAPSVPFFVTRRFVQRGDKVSLSW